MTQGEAVKELRKRGYTYNQIIDRIYLKQNKKQQNPNLEYKEERLSDIVSRKIGEVYPPLGEIVKKGFDTVGEAFPIPETVRTGLETILPLASAFALRGAGLSTNIIGAGLSYGGALELEKHLGLTKPSSDLESATSDALKNIAVGSMYEAAPYGVGKAIKETGVGKAIQKVSSPIVSKAVGAVKKPLEDIVQTLRGTKGMTADQIMSTHPNIKLTRDVRVKDVYGNKGEILKGEIFTPYEMKDGKIVLQDGHTYVVSKNQYQNIKGNAVTSEAKPFAPELKMTEEVVKGGLEDTNLKNPKLRALIRKRSSGEITIQEYNRQFEKLNLPKLDTKFSQYQLPGGENYKEILIKAPVKKITFSKLPPNYYVVKTSEDFYDKGNFKVIENIRGEGDRTMSIGATKEEAIQNALKNLGELRTLKIPTFKSPHWDEPNVISHLRLNERTYKGKKVTFMEELQSDWAREARKGIIDPRYKELEMKIEALQLKAGDAVREGKLDLHKQIKSQISTLQREKDLIPSGGVPNYPLLKKWQELSIKRALKEAVDNNSEYFSWINGVQTSARYNLATYLDNVKWREYNKVRGEKAVNLNTNEGASFNLVFGKDGIVKSSSKADWKGKKLDEVLGKGLADKLMEKESGTLSGEGLEFGGEWAINLYDKQVKNIVEDLTGAKVQTLDLGLPVENVKENISVKKTVQQGIKITPEIRAKIKGKALKLETSGKMFETPTIHDNNESYVAKAIKKVKK